MCLAALSACGGGGGSSDAGGSAGGVAGGAGVPVAVPTSGIYALDMTAAGPVLAPTFGLSLVHPSAPSAEFVIEPPSANVSDVVVVSSGSVAAAQLAINGVQPYSALYIVGGDVRRFSLIANGTAPLAQVQRSGSTGACRFTQQADDYATPDQSRYVVSTAGPDGVCGTADDGQADVLLTSTGGLSVTPVTANRRLGVVRDTGTFAPRGWITTNGLLFWSPVASLQTQQPLTSVVLNTVKSAVVETNGSLSVLDFLAVPGQPGLSQTPLNPALTAGTGWQSIGFDTLAYYVYRNSGSTAAGSTWSVLKIDRKTAAVTQLASGSGVLTAPAMGVSVLFVSETGVSANRLLTIAKAAPAQPTVLESSSSTLATVTASASGAHQLWRRNAVDGSGSTVVYINEAGVPFFSSTAGGYPLGRPSGATLDFNTSENHNAFVFANGYGATGFGSATLQTFDASAATSVVLGSLPAARFGTDPVVAGVTPTSSNFTAGYAARAPAGTIQAADEAAFSFDVKTPGSFKLTSTKQ